jgi:hypothetical protein
MKDWFLVLSTVMMMAERLDQKMAVQMVYMLDSLMAVKSVVSMAHQLVG